eukprot:m.145868 g.145868  ORF g.145868 m.145868 type:complete len:164 (+) comp17746_c0_seq1:60-551(+)
MAVLNVALLIVLVAAPATVVGSNTELARGWGDEIAWVPVGDAAAVAAETGKPIMHVIHKTWCGACKALKPKFAGSTDIRELSSKFVMVNAQDDEEPSGTAYAPDGGYIPRILFSDSTNKVDPEILNEPSRGGKYLYYYSDPAQIVAAMTTAAAKLTAKNVDEL